MTIEAPQTIDSIGVDKKTERVILKIFDHLDWSNENEHLLLLQSKINTYLSFIESGEVYEAYASANGKEFTISVDFLEKPVSNAIKFMDTSAKIIAEAGYELEYSVDSYE
jgi:hypothetical protein